MNRIMLGLSKSINSKASAPEATGNISTKAEVERMLKMGLAAGLDDIGNDYNNLETRVNSLENELKTEMLTQRLTQLEQTVQPYEEYKAQAQKAVKDLMGIKTSIAIAKSGNHVGAARVEEAHAQMDALKAETEQMKENYEALSSDVANCTDLLVQFTERMDYLSDQAAPLTLQDLLKRIRTLEGKESPVPKDLQTMTSNDLAKVLLLRLNEGQKLDGAVANRLYVAVAAATANGSRPRSSAGSLPPRVLNTPSTEPDFYERSAEKTTKFTNKQSERLSSAGHPTEPVEAQKIAKFTGTKPDRPRSSSRLVQAASAQKNPKTPNPLSKKRAFDEQNDDDDDDDDDDDYYEAADEPAGKSHKVTSASASPRKRRRLRKHPTPSSKAAAAAAAGASASPEVSSPDKDGDDTVVAPRRTPRAPKPTQKGENFMSWLEVKAARGKS